jgi:hypothetical protein
MKKNRAVRWSLIVLLIHLVLFLVAWGLAIYRAVNIPWLIEWEGFAGANVLDYHLPILVALFWALLFFTHACAHFYFAGRSDSSVSTRQAYRDGFRDGARYASDDALDSRRLTMDDDGEFVEMQLEEKQKRGER